LLAIFILSRGLAATLEHNSELNMNWIHPWIGFGAMTVTPFLISKLVIIAANLMLFLSNYAL